MKWSLRYLRTLSGYYQFENPYERNFQKGDTMESHLKHPINQFRLIRRYHKDWPYIRKLLGLDVKSNFSIKIHFIIYSLFSIRKSSFWKRKICSVNDEKYRSKSNWRRWVGFKIINFLKYLSKLDLYEISLKPTLDWWLQQKE